MEDIAPALLEQIKELYKNEKNSSIKIKNILDKLKEKNANFVDASEYANELGEILSKVFGDTFSVEVLPDGKMYYNIAKRTVEPTMKALQSDIADLTEELQENLNKQAGLGIKPLRPEVNQDRIDGIIDRLAEAENFDDIKWILQEPVKTFARSVVDDAILTNAEFHGKSGLAPKIIRKSSGNCCKWCTNLVGEYNYPNVPKDVYRRHNRCRCTVDYVVGKRKQNVWTKAWSEEIEPEKIEGRKAVEFGEDLTKSDIRKKLEQSGVEYKQVEYLKKKLSDDEIINRLAGGDMTKGSCSSLGFAYIGNKNGFDCIDFRGGKSQMFFARTSNIVEIANLKGINSTVIKEMNDFKGANELLKSMADNKEYYLATGRHAAIVKRVDGSYQYLELQSRIENGFKPLDNDVLKRRFGCQKSHTFAGSKYALDNVLIEVDSLKDNEEFRKILGYINTDTEKQKKGVWGSVK